MQCMSYYGTELFMREYDEITSQVLWIKEASVVDILKGQHLIFKLLSYASKIIYQRNCAYKYITGVLRLYLFQCKMIF